MPTLERTNEPATSDPAANANELTFGVEIETIAPDAAITNDGLRIGAYRHGNQVPYLPQGWTAERDASIHQDGGHACEIVSPVLKGAEGIAQVAEVLRTLHAKGHRVNASCGVHIHVGWKRTWSSDALLLPSPSRHRPRASSIRLERSAVSASAMPAALRR